MKSFSFAQALIAGSVLCFALPMACGDSEENPNPTPSDGGADGGGGDTGRAGEPPVAEGGGAGVPVMLPPGISDMASTIECSTSCESAMVGLGTMSFFLDPCCTDADDACGLNTAFLAVAGAAFPEACQPKNQPGDPDEACPSPPAAMIPFNAMMVTLDPFPGCCRPDGVCGVAVNAVSAGGGLLPLGDVELGCVDAAPFFPGEDPVPCGEGAGGAGGSGAGGAPAVVGGEGAGGASGGAGGAGGAN